MKRYIVFVLLCLATVTFCCKSRHSKDPFRITPTLAVDGFNDTTHISESVFEIETAFNSYFVPDGGVSKIFRIDSSLNLKEVVGWGGKGPGEMLNPTTLSFSSDTMYVLDAINIKVFENLNGHWKYRKSRKVPPLTALNENNPFFVHDGSIYFASPNEYWVSKYNLRDSTKVGAFGDMFDLQPRIDRNIMQLLNFNNSVYAIGVGEAVIYRYSYNGELISYRDFRDDEYFLESTTIQDRYYKEEAHNGLSTVFQAATVVDNKIHIVFYHRKKREMQFNEVLVVDPVSYEVTKVYELEKGGYYTCISPSLTSKNGFVVFNAKRARLELYDL